MPPDTDLLIPLAAHRVRPPLGDGPLQPRCSYCLPKGFTGFDEPDDGSVSPRSSASSARSRTRVNEVRHRRRTALVRRDLPVSRHGCRPCPASRICPSAPARCCSHTRRRLCAARLSGRARRQAVGEGKQRDLASSAIARGSSIRHALCSLSRWRAAICNTHVGSGMVFVHDKSSCLGWRMLSGRDPPLSPTAQARPIIGATGPAAHLVPGRLSGRLRHMPRRQVGGRVQVDIGAAMPSGASRTWKADSRASQPDTHEAVCR